MAGTVVAGVMSVPSLMRVGRDADTIRRVVVLNVMSVSRRRKNIVVVVDRIVRAVAAGASGRSR